MRAARVLWLVIFLIPLGVFADRFCYISFVDPLYHALLWLHERLPVLFVVLGALSAFAAGLRYARLQGQLRALEMLRSTPPDAVCQAFEHANAGEHAIELVYVDVPTVFCFAAIGDRVVISRGFAELLNASELRLVAAHELAHIKREDPLSALLWHIFLAALIVPGFERLEEVLYAWRERQVDLLIGRRDPVAYDDLVGRFVSTMCGTPGAAFRYAAPGERNSAVRILMPVAVPIAMLVLLVVSHVLFVHDLPYLQFHHC